MGFRDRKPVPKIYELFSLCRVLDLEIDSIVMYINCSEKWIEKEYIEFNKIREDWENKNKEYWDDPFDYELEMMSSFRPINNNSLFVTIYSLLEHYYIKICNRASECLGKKVNVKDLAGNGIIDKTRNYLTKILEIDLDDLNEYWIFLKDCQKIRHKIVHSNSEINAGDGIKRVIEKYPNDIVIHFDKEFYIYNTGFLKKFVQTVDKYLNCVSDKIINAYK